jgi:hypothetical protein
MRYVSGPDSQWLNRRAGLQYRPPVRFYTLNSLRGFGTAASPIGQGTGQGAVTGASEGASIGSAIPVIGTAIGAVVGAAVGAIAGSINKMDPEQRNFDQAIAVWQQNPAAVFNILNKYLPLAGFFDLTNSQAGKIRIYRKYGRMGEQRFVNDMMGLVLNAAQTGQIGPADTPMSVYSKIVLPWEDSWGFGPEPPNPHSGFMDNLLTGLIWDYTLGNQKNWTARSGDYPFANLPPFSLPMAQTPSTAAPVAAPAVVAQPTVSTTVPNLGAAIGYAKDDTTGAMVAIPAGGTYAGLSPYGGWLIQYGASAPNGAGIYVARNGAVVPYYNTPTSTTSNTIPAGYTLTSQTAMVNGVAQPLYADANNNLYVWQNGQMVPYSAAVASSVVSSSGGGGGGYYVPPSAPADTTPLPVVATPSSGLDSNTLLLIGGGLLAFTLLKGKR